MAANRTRRGGGIEALRDMRRALLRASVLFGSLAVVFAFAMSPREDVSRFASAPFGVDEMATGSIGGGSERYTVRRSVLDAPGTAPCLVFFDGSRRGNC